MAEKSCYIKMLRQLLPASPSCSDAASVLALKLVVSPVQYHNPARFYTEQVYGKPLQGMAKRQALQSRILQGSGALSVLISHHRYPTRLRPVNPSDQINALRFIPTNVNLLAHYSMNG